MKIIGQTPCEACGGSGLGRDEKPCEVCAGTGLIGVLESGKLVPARERRRWPRYQLMLSVSLLNPAKPDEPILAGHGTEMNHGGLTVIPESAPSSVAVGDRIAIDLTAPQSPPARVQCMVRHSSMGRLGLEFQPATPAEEDGLSRLRRYLSGS